MLNSTLVIFLDFEILGGFLVGRAFSEIFSENYKINITDKMVMELEESNFHQKQCRLFPKTIFTRTQPC